MISKSKIDTNPCLHCGSDNVILVSDDNGSVITCGDCGVCGPSVSSDDEAIKSWVAMCDKPEEQWGVGNKATEKAFDKVKIGSAEAELFFGEHPHSRQDNNIYARFDDGTIHGFSGNRPLVKIEISESNYLKESHISGDEVRASCSANIYANDRLIYSFSTRNHLDALHKASYIIAVILEHPIMYDFMKTGDISGRKVYYRDVPMVCERYDPKYGCVYANVAEGETLSVPCWTSVDDHDPLFVKDDILSDHWYWFRDNDERK